MLSLDERRPPVPPADLVLRVIPPFDAGDIEGTRWSFDVGGFRNLLLYERALASVSPWRFGGEVWLTDERVPVGYALTDLDRGCAPTFRSPL